MTRPDSPTTPGARGRRRVIALAGGVGLTVTLLAIAFVLAMSSGAARIADNAQALHWANATAGTAALARAATAQAVVFGVDQELGVASIEARNGAVSEASSVLDGVESWIQGADEVDPALQPELEPTLQALGTFVAASRETIALVMAGDAGAANRIRVDVAESAYQTSTAGLVATQDTIAGRISNTERLAGALGMVTQILATLLIPAAAIIAYFVLVRRQYRVERLQMEANIEAERELGRAKDEFIAGISHELRTPLTGIYGFSEYLIEQGALDPAEAIELIGHINHEASELSRMVEDLLSAARLQSDALDFSTEPVDVLAMVHEVVAPLDRSGHTVEVDGKEVLALADPTRTRQIVRNLVSNAIKHGGDRIRVTVDRSGDQVTVTVADSGDGVPETVQERLFDRFVHAGAESLLTGSVGLGLSIAKSLAQHMDGDIGYVRALGWTNFVVTLPLAAPFHEDEPHELPAILQLGNTLPPEHPQLQVASMRAAVAFIGADDPFAKPAAHDFVVRFD